MSKKMFGALCAGLMFGLMTVPAMADGDITVSVGVYDYAAMENGLEGASEFGVILDQVQVKVPEGTTALAAVKQAFEENNIPYVATDSGYVAEINGLAAGINPTAVLDYSGWMLEYNGDGFTNWGLSFLGPNGDGILAEGDALSFDYSLCAGADFTTPSLTELIIGDTVVSFSKEFTGYDDTYTNAIFDYKMNGEAIEGTGTEEDPFVVNVDLGTIEDTKVTTGANASIYYNVEGVTETADAAEEMKVTVSTRYGKTATYVVKMTYELKAPEKQEPEKEDILPTPAPEVGDMAGMPMVMLAGMLVVAGLVAKKTKRA